MHGNKKWSFRDHSLSIDWVWLKERMIFVYVSMCSLVFLVVWCPMSTNKSFDTAMELLRCRRRVDWKVSRDCGTAIMQILLQSDDAKDQQKMQDAKQKQKKNYSGNLPLGSLAFPQPTWITTKKTLNWASPSSAFEQSTFKLM